MVTMQATGAMVMKAAGIHKTRLGLERAPSLAGSGQNCYNSGPALSALNVRMKV